MLPYLAQPRLALGPITLYAFGVLVAVAVYVGARMAHRRARATGVEESRLTSLLSFVLVGGFLGGHVLDILLYEPATIVRDPLRLLRLWDGLGSFGGFVGAIVGATIFFARTRRDDAWPLVDSIAYGFPFGWIFGRLGCALAYDHVGRATSFFLGQRYSDGVVRHNLGLEEALYTIVLAIVFFVVGRKPRRAGFFVGLLALLYAPVRFMLDTLRVEDARYLGMTPAQYGSILLAAIGVAILMRSNEGAAPATPPTPPGSPAASGS
jgi:phosphatidylglycerol:prolipoprotein diacylglycerol transferase